MIATFFHWWFEQLRSLLPARSRHGIARDHIVLTVCDGRCGATVRRASGDQPLGSFTCDESGARALYESVGAIEGSPDAAVLNVPVSQILTKTLSLPMAARRNVAQVLEFEIDHETPFRSTDVIWSHETVAVDRAHERLTVELHLVPRATIAGVAGLAGAAGLRVSAIEFTPEDGRPRRIALGDDTTAWTSRRQLAFTSALAVLVLVAVAIPFLRVGHALNVTRGEIERMSAVAREAVALKREIADASKASRLAADERHRVRDPLRVLAAATAALPDDTHLTGFSLRGEQATLVGLSPSAAGLIPSLAATQPFRDPAFASAVTRPDGADLELFTIKARVDPTDAR